MGKTTAWLPVAVLVLFSGGCANLVTRKVPVEDRIAGCDDKVEGFRYYLSRPYLVVAERVELAHDYMVGTIEVFTHPTTGKTKQVFRSVFTNPETGESLLYELNGEEIALAAFREQGWAEAPVTAAFPDDPQSKEILEGIDRLGRLFNALKESVDKLALKVDQQPGVTIPPKLDITFRQGTISTTGGPGVPRFQVVFLPDFEEQMAIKDRNLLAYSKYNLHFADGWQLAGVNGSFDETEVPVRVLQSIANAVSAAAEVKTKALTALPLEGRALAPLAESTADRLNRKTLILRTVTYYLEPGLYRLRKSSEMAGHEPCVGLLTELGIPVQTDVKMQVVAADQ